MEEIYQLNEKVRELEDAQSLKVFYFQKSRYAEDGFAIIAAPDEVAAEAFFQTLPNYCSEHAHSFEVLDCRTGGETRVLYEN